MSLLCDHCFYYCFELVDGKMNLSPSAHEHHHRHRRRSSRQDSDEERTNYIIETFLKNFGDNMRENPKGWRSRFRKMSENEFAFYRGSAVLFYRDMQEDARQDRWLSNCQQATRIFIHVSVSNSLPSRLQFFDLGRSTC